MKEETRAWWDMAKLDMSRAARILAIDEPETAAFLAQQAVEKALKSMLIERTGRYPRIHDLKELARQACASNEIVALAVRINPAYISTRYPDIPGRIDPKSAREIVAMAKEVMKWVESTMNY